MKLPRALSAGETVGPIAYNLMRGFVASLAPISSPTVRHDWRPGGVTSHASRGKAGVGASSGIDLGQITFGYDEIDQVHQRVHILGGMLNHGKRRFTLADTYVSISGGAEDAPQVVVVRYSFGANPEIVPNALDSLPLNTDDVMTFRISSWYLDTSRRVTFVRQHRLADIEIPGVAA